MVHIFKGIAGIVVFLLICYISSSNRKLISWKLVITGIGMTFLLAWLILKVRIIHEIFAAFSSFFVLVQGFTKAGTSFVFGNLINEKGIGYIFAFQALPVIVFFSALTSMLYYYKVLQKIIYFLALMLRKSMRLSGPESFSAAANIFLGQTEAPLLIKPYLKNLNDSEMLLVMTGGMATIAGSVLAAYVGFLGGDSIEAQKTFATHLLCASVMATPVSIVCSKMFLPQTEEIREEVISENSVTGSNVLDAISEGTTEGLKLAVNVGAMIIVFIALMAMFNYFMENFIGKFTGLNDFANRISEGHFKAFTLQFILGYLMAPVAWLMGVPDIDIVKVGQLLGEKTVLNEFVAFISLGEMKTNGGIVEYRSVIIATYALSGFANFGSIGIQIGGIGTLAPSKKSTVSRLAVKSLVAGSLASFITAAIAGMLI